MKDDTGDEQAAAILRNMARVERKCQVHQCLNAMRHSTSTQSGITRLQVPRSWPTSAEYETDPDMILEDPKSIADAGDWKEINCPSEMEFLLGLRNQRHFGQAETEGTPFTSDLIKPRMTWSANANTAELTLQGDCHDQDLDAVSNMFLDNLTRVTELDSVPKYVTPEDMRGKFKVWRETTSTSPSGRHLGHCKALFATADHSLPEDERTKCKDIQHEIATAYATIINYAIKHKCFFKRWRQIVNMMTHKQPGNIKIHRLRVIHLHEADLNFLLGLKWKDAMHKAQKENTLHPGQCGSRPGRDPTTVTLLEELRLDCSLLTRTPCANFDNDASSCYDRTLLPISSLVARGYGIHRNVVFVHAQTLQDAIFKLKLSTKVSDVSYKHCTKFPIHGSGQGSANSPIIWCFISSKLFSCHHSKAHGFHLQSPDGSLSLQVSIVGFVDDSTCVTGGDPNKPLTDLLSRMQHDAQTWNDLLWTSGGKLELPKCGFHAICYDFHPSGLPRMVPSHNQPVSVLDATRSPIPIEAKNAHTPRKNLGHCKAPAGTSKTQSKAIMTKAASVSEAIAQCPVTRNEAKLLCDAVYRPAVEYPIPQSFLSPKQLSQMQQKTLPKIVAKCGYNRTTSRNIIFGPAAIGGAGFVPLEAAAGAGCMTHLLKHWRTPYEEAGKTIRLVLAWSQFHSGMPHPILSRPDICLPHVPDRFYSAVRRHLNDIGGQIVLDNPCIHHPLHRGDIAIMQLAMDEHECTDAQLKKINCVRLCLGVTFLSETCFPDGRRLSNSLSRRLQESDLCTVTTARAHQKCPSPHSWALFRTVFADHVKQDKVTLIRPLGKWTEHHSRQGPWHACVNCADNILHIRQPNLAWNRCAKVGTKLKLKAESVPFTPTKLFRPAVVHKLTNGDWHCDTHSSKDVTLPPRQLPTRSWTDVVDQQPVWARQLIDRPEVPNGLDDLLETIHSCPHLLVVSDGSVKQFRMTHGWLLCSPQGRRLAFGHGPDNGRPSSLRSEAAGMLAASTFLAMFQDCCNFTPPLKTHFYSDNLELIRRQTDHLLCDRPYPNQTLKAEFDLTEQTCLTHKIHRIQGAFTHAKGHQDDHTDYDALSLEAQLNVDADDLAETHHEHVQKHPSAPKTTPRTHMVPACPAMLIIRGHTITNDHKHQLIRAYTEPRCIAHLQEKFKWNNSVAMSIAWKSLACGIRRMDRPCLTTKICNNLLPTATQLQKWKHQNHDTCCLCSQRETSQHLHVCPHKSRAKWRMKFVLDLRKHLQSPGTKEGITETMCRALTHYLDHQFVPTHRCPTRYHRASHSQTHTGWDHVFMGHPSTKWETLQGNYFAANGDCRPVHLWSSSVAEFCLRRSIALWEQRNQDVHGHDLSARTQKLLERHKKTVSYLHSLQDKARPRDHHLFPDDISSLFDRCTVTSLGNWIAAYRPRILQSVRQASRESSANTHNTTTWFPPLASSSSRGQSNSNPVSAQTATPNSSKKTPTSPPQHTQLPITHCLSLRNAL